MSASDAAPLPRLGEVFFDVRGSSRSMRLSWYADTGVAVFSIWQGGMCTGTFRLAIADLPRMVDTLQHGPAGQSSGDDPDLDQAFGDDPLGYRTGRPDPLNGPAPSGRWAGQAGRSAADYPAHYGAAVTDDIGQSPPPPESFPYGPPPGNRGPAGRHADREAPFD